MRRDETRRDETKGVRSTGKTYDAISGKNIKNVACTFRLLANGSGFCCLCCFRFRLKNSIPRIGSAWVGILGILFLLFGFLYVVWPLYNLN